MSVRGIVQSHPLRKAPQTGGSSHLPFYFSSLVSSSLNRIDEKMSGGQSGYELSEAKAILTELKSIRKAISSGEKEKQDLMQVCRGVPVSPLTPIAPTLNRL